MQDILQGPFVIVENEGAYVEDDDLATLRIEERATSTGLAVALMITDCKELADGAGHWRPCLPPPRTCFGLARRRQRPTEHADAKGETMSTHYRTTGDGQTEVAATEPGVIDAYAAQTGPRSNFAATRRSLAATVVRASERHDTVRQILEAYIWAVDHATGRKLTWLDAIDDVSTAQSELWAQAERLAGCECRSYAPSV